MGGVLFQRFHSLLCCYCYCVRQRRKFVFLLTAAHYNDVGQEVVLATDEVGVIKLVQPVGVRQDMVQTHLSPVAGVAFSPCFNHLITASRDGVSPS